MRRGVIEIDCPADPLPSSDEGSFRDRPQAITDNSIILHSLRFFQDYTIIATNRLDR